MSFNTGSGSCKYAFVDMLLGSGCKHDCEAGAYYILSKFPILDKHALLVCMCVSAAIAVAQMLCMRLLLQLGEGDCIGPLCQFCSVECFALLNEGSKCVCRHAVTLKHQQQKHIGLSP